MRPELSKTSWREGGRGLTAEGRSGVGYKFKDLTAAQSCFGVGFRGVAVILLLLRHRRKNVGKHAHFDFLVGPRRMPQPTPAAAIGVTLLQELRVGNGKG